MLSNNKIYFFKSPLNVYVDSPEVSVIKEGKK